ncbi:DUF2905 domain-containing protein [Candidatus Saganbacteria bacterium]|nr:DUF2905 domain-containing protein [Candidatus Saganbacteria bacterium]
MALEGLGRLLIYIGVIIVMIGAFLLLVSKLPWFGRLPGDIAWQKDGWTIYVPLTTMVLVSIVITIILNFVFRK